MKDLVLLCKDLPRPIVFKDWSNEKGQVKHVGGIHFSKCMLRKSIFEIR